MKTYMTMLLGGILLCQSLILNAIDPIKGYTAKTIEGRTVYVEDLALTSHAKETQEALDLLKTKLQEIDQMNMCVEAKNVMKSTKFFMEWALNEHGAAVYHPSKEWLVNNGWLAEKAKSINITNIKNFINWTAQNQPYMVLHELSHAYHNQVLGDDQADIKAAYEAAMASEIYFGVSYFDGQSTHKLKAYACNNTAEYFAELTEAFYGKNDYYPFIKSELEIFDAKGFAALKKVWQKDAVIESKVVNNNAAFDATKYYRLTVASQGKGKSLDIINDEQDNKTCLAKSGNYSGQHWKIEKLSNGYYRLTTAFQGKEKSLDIVNDEQDNKTCLAKSGNYSGQHWKIEKLSNGYYRLSTQFQGEAKCLDLGKDLAPMLKAKAESNTQFWEITEVK